MRVAIKTFGWLVVSGTIIFISNIIGGSEILIALYGAIVAKIGTTIAYFFYEVGFEKAYPKHTAEALPNLDPPPAHYTWHGEDEALPEYKDKQLPCV
jgi:uncharacterized membrane protein